VPSSDPCVSVIAVVADEPAARLLSMFTAVASQDAVGAVDLVVAAPPADHPTVEACLRNWSRGPVTLIANPGGNRSRGLNACLAAARGAVVVRVDARSVLPADYVRRCVDRLRADADVTVVGGHQVAAVPPEAGARRRGIARALRHPFLLGGAAYRDPDASGAVDTVYLGAFRLADATHLRYDETLTANEDYDLCARVRADGGTVYLEPGLDVRYEPRCTYRGLAEQYHAFGRAKTTYWRTRGHGPRGRQRTALALAAIAAVGTLGVAVVWPPALVIAAGLAGVAYLVADAVGDRSPGSVATHVAAVAAHVIIETAWCSGVVTEWLAPRTSGDVEHALERDAGVRRGDRVDRDPVDHLAAGE
jgi:succinoglycan biosynthesis protein ExoA